MKRVFADQKSPARLLADLKDLQDRLEDVAKQRQKESSKRWLAHYDYTLAHVQLRYAYIHEYDLMLAQIRKNQMPDLDPKQNQNGWRLVAQDALNSPGDVKDTAKAARKLLGNIVKDHAGTPWAALADRDLNTQIGLRWEPVVIAGAAGKK
jgi:hypothetical protein